MTVVGSAIAFFTAGYDSTAITMAFMAFELAKNPDVQKRLRDEMDEAYQDNDGQIPPYIVLMNLPYLDMVINEVSEG